MTRASALGSAMRAAAARAGTGTLVLEAGVGRVLEASMGSARRADVGTVLVLRTGVDAGLVASCGADVGTSGCALWTGIGASLLGASLGGALCSGSRLVVGAPVWGQTSLSKLRTSGVTEDRGVVTHLASYAHEPWSSCLIIWQVSPMAD